MIFYNIQNIGIIINHIYLSLIILKINSYKYDDNNLILICENIKKYNNFSKIHNFELIEDGLFFNSKLEKIFILM